MDELEFKLQQLREAYKTANRSERTLLEMRARLLKIAIELRGAYEPKSEDLTETELNELFS